MIHCCQGKLLEAGNTDDSEAEYYCVVYRPLISKEQAPYMHCAFDVEIGQNPKLVSLLEQYIKAVGKPDSDSRFRAKVMIYSILSEIFISMRNAETTESHSVILEAKNYMDAHYIAPCSLSELSARYGMGSKYFSELFKKHTGVSPTDYMISLRMKQAYQLLMTTSCTVKEISQSIGYSDAYYFSRLFKKKYGISPDRLRKNGFAGCL